MVDSELQALQRLNGLPGIVRMYDYGNSLQGKATSANQYPLDFYIVQEKGQSFGEYPWDDQSPQCWTVRANLCKQLLKGLTAIHHCGWIHRDITPSNILFFDGDPRHAALCDFGAVCRRPTDVDTAIAAWKFLPPELQKGQLYLYNQKIDVWMLSLSLIMCWFPDTISGLDARDDEKHKEI